MPKIPFWVFIIIGLLYFTAVRVDTMDVDASQYAEMSREMMHSHNWLELHDRGLEYLDKPPFLFWISAASMRIFGVNNFGYKLPSILFALWAIYATYRLAKLLYGDATARMAALILATCQGLFLMTNDIRCDTILMSWVITAIWLIKEWDVQRRPGYLLAGFAGLALGFLLFALGWIGGGDAKLFGGVTLWLGFADMMPYALMASIFGGFLTLALLVMRQWPLPGALARQPWILRLHDSRSGIPYGVALAAGAFILLPNTEIFRLAAGG